MVSYPSIALPSTSFSEASEVTTLRTEGPDGLVRQRPRFSTGTKTIRANWVLTSEEYATLQEWFDEDLSGGVLSFAIPWDQAIGVAFRFVDGRYDATAVHGGDYQVSAVLEVLEVHFSNATEVLPVPPWNRLLIDPAGTQQLTLSHRNALLTVRPDDESVTTLRVFAPTDPEFYIYFGIENLGDGDTLITSEDSDPPEVLPAASWPGSLPDADAGLSAETAQQVSRQEMDGGHARQFQRFDSSSAEYGVSWEFSAAQMAAFETFFYTTLRNGSRPFTVTLPVDGEVLPVRCQFNGGFSTRYVPTNRFRVSASLDRVASQEFTPSEATPYGLYYSPTVQVTSNHKVTAGDAGKFFVVTAAEGQTVNLHIGETQTEFGVLLLGEGSLLITRAPFFHSLYPDSDEAASSIGKPEMALVSVLLDIEVPSENVNSSIGKPSMELLPAIAEVDDIGDGAASTINLASLELVVVLISIEDSEDNAASSIGKPSIELIVP